MTTFLPKEVRDGLDAARLASLKKASRLRVEVDGMSYPVLSLWQTGVAVEAATAPKLRGLVDLFDGARHLYECLIVATEEEAGEMRYSFKRNTVVQDTAPLDYYRAPNAPVALLGKDS